MRATIKLLIAIAVLLTLVAPAAEAVPPRCMAGGICPGFDFKPNHICYLPGTSYAADEGCRLPLTVVDLRFNPPRPMVAPTPMTFMYDVLPVDGPPRGFVPVLGNRATIAAGATGGAVPVQLLAGSPLLEERALVQIRYGGDPVLTAELMIRRG
ncbi:hypothetical protein [Actinophytocola sp.]|uniref:hypothetical protein n=1 Tax=Actinophytocola sp. TaxID=1872138 RepID=UPI002ED64030